MKIIVGGGCIPPHWEVFIYNGEGPDGGAFKALCTYSEQSAKNYAITAYKTWGKYTTQWAKNPGSGC